VVRCLADMGPRTILLVDDDDAIRRVIRSMLELNGYDVLDAGVPSIACVLFDKDPAAIDLLVTDIKMPGMSGQELAARLELTRPDLPVLFISGCIDATFAPDLRGPQRNVLAKPFEATVLLDAAHALLSTIRR
jgi:two-component system, cell cycle sensor histidine kinase and response regulator CckA